MQDLPESQITEADLPPSLKRLRALVTVLTVVMIAGVITITALLVIRLNSGGEVVLITPERFELPEGVGVVGYSVVNGRTLIIGDDGVIRVFDTGSADLIQEIPVD
ncbi:MAG: DUF6476 family protein [Pseudomonadota bacterium]